jgi:transposase
MPGCLTWGSIGYGEGITRSLCRGSGSRVNKLTKPPPWHTVYQQSQRWLKAKVFEALVHDLREVLRVAPGRNALPSAAIFDSRTLQSTPESGTRAGYDGAKRRRGSKVHMAVDTLGHLLALHVTAANAQDRSQVHTLAEKGQEVTGDAVEIAYVDQGDTGAQAAQALGGGASSCLGSALSPLSTG